MLKYLNPRNRKIDCKDAVYLKKRFLNKLISFKRAYKLIEVKFFELLTSSFCYFYVNRLDEITVFPFRLAKIVLSC